MRASAQLEAAMSAMGRASSQREDLSTTVNRYLQEKEGGDRSTTLQAGLWLLH